MDVSKLCRMCLRECRNFILLCDDDSPSDAAVSAAITAPTTTTSAMKRSARREEQSLQSSRNKIQEIFQFDVSDCLVDCPDINLIFFFYKNYYQIRSQDNQLISQ